MPGFFDRFPEFYRAGAGRNANRLNARHRALIEEHRAHFAGARVLDIASHTGRWSIAALEAGARNVLGVEPRAELVAKANELLAGYGRSPGEFRFVQNNIHREIRALPDGSVDVVLLLGFFYHTLHHYYLLQQIRRLGARAIVIDTEVDPDLEDPMIRLREDNADSILGAASDDGSAKVLIGVPSRAAIELMLRTLGYEARYYDWHQAGIVDWEALDDYRANERVSLIATPIAG